MKQFLTFTLLLITILASFHPVQAQGTPSCVMNLDGSITCTTGGGGGSNDGNNSGGGNNDPNACTPGEHLGVIVVSYDASAGMCEVMNAWVDNCTGEMTEPAADHSEEVARLDPPIVPRVV